MQQPPASYGAQQPMGMPPQNGPAPTPTPPAAVGKGLLYAGLGLAAAGLIAGVAMYALSSGAEAQTVKKFARAPVGCTTTLEFEKRATFTLYVETKGTLGAVGGDCAATGSYERGDDDRPQVVLSMVDANDEQVELSAVTAARYDVGSHRGSAVQQVTIAEPGTYRLTVASEDADFAIAIGGAPDADSSSMQSNGIIAAIVGIVLGGLLLLLWKRKKGAGAVPAFAGQQPSGAPGWQGGASVPGYQQPPQQPQYQQPQYQQSPPQQYPQQYPQQPQQPQQPAYQAPPQQPQQPAYQPPPQQYPQQQPAPSTTPPEDRGWGAPQQ